MATVGGGQGRGGGAGGGGGGGDGPWRNPWDSKKIGGCGVSSSKDINVSWRAYLKYNFFFLQNTWFANQFDRSLKKKVVLV